MRDAAVDPGYEPSAERSVSRADKYNWHTIFVMYKCQEQMPFTHASSQNPVTDGRRACLLLVQGLLNHRACRVHLSRSQGLWPYRGVGDLGAISSPLQEVERSRRDRPRLEIRTRRSWAATPHEPQCVHQGSINESSLQSSCHHYFIIY